MYRSSILAFVAGGIIGSIVTWFVAKNRFAYKPKETETPKEDKPESEEVYISKGKPPMSEEELDAMDDVYHDLVSNYDTESEEVYKSDRDYIEEGGNPEDWVEPYPIAYDEYADILEYDAKNVNWYADDIVADDWGYVYKDPEKVFGIGWKGEFKEDDVAYFRNENYHTDYEMCRDDRTFEQAMKDIEDAVRT